MKSAESKRQSRNAYMREYLRRRRAATKAAQRADSAMSVTRARPIGSELRAWCEERGYTVTPASRIVTVAAQAARWAAA